MRAILFIIPVGLASFFSACNSTDQPGMADIQRIENELVSENNRASALHEAGIALGKVLQCDIASEKYKEAIAIRRALIPKLAQAQDSTKNNILLGIFKSLQNQSNCYYGNGNYEKSYELQQEALSFLDSLPQYRQVFEWEIPRRITAYHYMGRVQQELGNLEESLRNYQTAHTLCVQYPKINAERCRDMYITYSSLYVNWQEADSIIRYAMMAIETGFRDFDSYKPYMNCGIGYALKKQYVQALEQYDLARANHPNEWHKAMDFHNRALLYLENSELREAMNHVLEAIAINTTLEQTDEARKKNLAENYCLKGDILRENKNYDDAIIAYDLALPILTNIPAGNLNPGRIKTIAIEKFYSNKIGTLEAIFGKAKTLYAQKKYQEALAYYDAAIHLTNRFRQSFSDQSSKIKLAALTKKIFEGAIEACLAVSEPEKAFSYMEQSKSFALLENVLQLKAMERLPDIDPELQEAWNNARTEINRLTQDVSNHEDSVELVLELRQQISDQQAMQFSIEAEFQKNEAYTKLTGALTPPDVASIQNQLLEEGQALAEYFVGEKQSYLFYIPKNGNLKIYPLNIDRETLAQKSDSLLLAIRLPHTELSRITDEGLRAFYRTPDMEIQCDRIYAAYALELYNKLLAVSGPLPKRLIIIPDDVLGYLPFDALLTKQPEQIGHYADYPFLWQSPCYISYCYSGALLKEMKDNNNNTDEGKMIAFGNPEVGFQVQIRELETLFYSTWNFLSNNFKVIKTKEQLKIKVKDASYLHFSTHGKVDDRNPNYSYLDMKNRNEAGSESNRLYLYDIYGLKARNTAMVVTSACETGLGKLYHGEGIISLARGFSAAGASSIITTLWSVYQKESGEIFTNFYKNILDGKTSKDEALTNAKASFFKEKGHKQVAPYYWAGIVPVGEMEPVILPQSSGRSLPVLISGSLILVLAISLLVRKKRLNS